jgi:hypothetical protein
MLIAMTIIHICEDVRHFSQHSYNATTNSHNGQLTLHTKLHASDSGIVWWEGRTILGAKSKLSYSETALSSKSFRIGHMYIYTFLLRMTNTMTSQNTDLSSWVILYKSKPLYSGVEQGRVIYTKEARTIRWK